MSKWQITETVSFDIDAQKGFSPLCPNELPVSGGDEIVKELNAQAGFATWRFGSKDMHPANALWRTDDPTEIMKRIESGDDIKWPNIDVKWPMHCASGTRGAELLDGLPKPEEYDFFVWKGTEKDLHPYSAVWHDLSKQLSTGVIEFMYDKKITTAIVGGLATDYCLASTAEDLKSVGFNVIVNLGACRGVAKETTESAIVRMKAKGIIFVDCALELIRVI